VKKTNTLITYALALKDFVDFIESQNPFLNTLPMKDLDLLPHKCWDLIRASGRTLAPIAYRILAQVCFTSSCEQNWNSYSFVHNKMQNWLTLNHAKDLVYIYTNNKLL
jgi:hypothetical protein